MIESLVVPLLLLPILIFFGLAALQNAAPTIFIVPFAFLAGLNLLFVDYSALRFLLLLIWLLTFVGLTLWCGHNRLTLRNIRISFDTISKFRQAHGWRFALFVLGFIASVAFWSSQAGLESLESRKRIDSSSDYYNIANFFTGAYIMFPIYIFGIRSIGRSAGKHYVVFSLIILAWAFLQGYLSSDRGIFFYTILLIILMRVCQQAKISNRIGIALLGAIAILVQLPIMAQISAERANREGTGYQILYQQAFNASSGYGFAISKDEAVYEFVERSGSVMDPIYLLGGIYGIVPRVWWEGKPDYVGTGPIAGALVFRGESYVTRGAGIPISMPSEFALAFGLSAFWVGIGFYFLLALAACHAIRRWPLYCVPLMIFITDLAGGGLPKSMISVFLNIFAILLISKLLGFRVILANQAKRRPFPPPNFIRRDTALPS